MKRLIAMTMGLALLSTAALAETPYTIAFSVKTVTNDDFQKAIATSIQEAVEKSGNKFLLVTAGDETGVSTQVNQVEDLLAKKVDAIILSPMDGKAVVPVLKKAQADKIPVIVVDSSVEKGNEGLYISYVGTDNFNAGKAAGQRMVKELGGQGNVLIVRGANGSLSRDSLFDQRTDVSLSVQGDNRGVNGPVEVVGVGEGLVGEMVGFEIAPDGFDVVEFGRVLGQPFDGEPMGAGGKRGDAGLAHVDRAVVEHDDDRPDRQAWPRAIKAVEPPQQRNEIGAALGFAGVHDEPASGVVEHPDHCHLLGLAGRRHTQIGATLSPGSGQVRMRQRLALVGEQEHDIAGLRLRLAQRQPEADAIDGVGVLAALQSVSRPTPAEFFFRSTLDRRDLEMVTPSRASISPIRRASVQLRRSATGASSNGATTLSAASALTGAGPDAGRVSSASTPPRAKSLRHRRTVSSRTPNASAMRGLVQPDSVSNKARARSASPRSRETASLRNPAFCSSPAATGDLPAMSHPRESTRKRNHSRHPLASQMKPA